MINKRDTRLDLLKAIGLLMLVLAHTGLKNTDPVYHLRCFDVPLMIMLSGVSYSYKQELGNLFGFFKKRIFRLVIPAWIFSLGYYFIGYKLFGYDHLSTYLKSGLLLSGPTYMWIYRIFLYMMLLTPLLFLLRKTKQIALVLLLCATVWSAVCLYCGDNMTGVLKQLGFVAGYGIIFAVGFFIKDSPKAVMPLVVLSIIGTLWFMGQGIVMSGTYFPFSNYKWPPTVPFICYGLTISAILYFVVFRLTSPSWQPSVVLTYIGRRTDAIYLVHIGYLEIIFANPYLKYLLVLVCSIITVWIYDLLKKACQKLKAK